MYNGTSPHSFPYTPQVPENVTYSTMEVSAGTSLCQPTNSSAALDTRLYLQAGATVYMAHNEALHVSPTPNFDSEHYNFLNHPHMQSPATGSIHHQYMGAAHDTQFLNTNPAMNPVMPSFHPQASHPLPYDIPAQHVFPSTGTNDPIAVYPSPAQSTLRSPDFIHGSGQATAYHQDAHTGRHDLDHHGTTDRKKPHSAERQNDLLRSRDPRFKRVVSEVVKIMTEVEVPKDRPISQKLLQEKVQKLNRYLKIVSDSDGELQQWLQLLRDQVGTLAGRDIAFKKRKTSEDSKLFICLWCLQTLTVKNNLGNHVRSHLKFPLSFCDLCDFSSVTPRLPTRHLKIHNKQENSVSRRAQTPYNNILPTSNPLFLGSFSGALNWA